MMDFLQGKARDVATRVVAEEEARRRHLVIALSGAHAYGFPSPDSDLDLKAIHIEPAERLLGLDPPKESADRLEVMDGVEVDYTSNELRPVLAGILGGNGNYIERVCGALIVHSSAEHGALRELVPTLLSRRVYRHYRGFAANQRQAFESAEVPTAKKLLYVLRTTLTGAHLLRTGELVVDLSETAAEYGVVGADELIQAKKQGERTVLSEPVRQSWSSRLDRLFALLDDARDSSVLPEEPPGQAELSRWLLAVRENHFAV